MIPRVEIPPLTEVERAPQVLVHVIGDSEVDPNGHLDVRRYFDLHMLACEDYFTSLGLDDEYRQRTGLTVFSLAHHIAYVDEVRVSQHVTVHVQLTSMTDKVVHGWSAVLNGTEPAVSSVCRFTDASAGLTSRRLEPFAEPLAGALRTAVDDRQTPT